MASTLMAEPAPIAAMLLAVGLATSGAEVTRVAIVTAAATTRTQVVAVATVEEAVRVTVEVLVGVADNFGNKVRNESSWPQRCSVLRCY
jgi:hypothetical protein